MYFNIKRQSSTIVKLKLLLPQPNTLNSACDIFSFKWQVDENSKKTRSEVELVFPRKASVYYTSLGFPGGWDGKESASNAGDLGSIPGLGGSPGGGHGNPFQYSCVEDPHGQRNLVGYSPWGCKESDATEHTAYTPIILTSKPPTYSAFQTHYGGSWFLVTSLMGHASSTSEQEAAQPPPSRQWKLEGRE